MTAGGHSTSHASSKDGNGHGTVNDIPVAREAAAANAEDQARPTGRVTRLIDSLTSQLIDGCGNKECSTPCCYTYRSMKHHVPVRKYSELSARAIAFTLATSEDPSAYICPLVSADAPESARTPQNRTDPKALVQQLFNTKAVRTMEFQTEVRPIDRVLYEISQRLSALLVEQPNNSSNQGLFDCIFILCYTLPWHENLDLAPLPWTKANDYIWQSLCEQELPDFHTPEMHPKPICVDFQDAVWYPPAVRSRNRVIRLLWARMRAENNDSDLCPSASIPSFMRLDEDERPGLSLQIPTTWLLHLHHTFLQEWNGKPNVNTAGLAGMTLAVIEALWKAVHDKVISIPKKYFTIPRLDRQLDYNKVALGWLQFTTDRNNRHILSYRFLFSEHALTTMFRTANYKMMQKAYSDAETTVVSRTRIMNGYFRPADRSYLDRRLKVAQEHYLVLEVSRQCVLSDALDQLWQRERRELFRPLRVRMGLNEGEIGADHGGVQVEFFNLVCQEAFHGDRSLFVTDSRTQLSWFQPASMEPLHRYELLGLLFGLAVYNGITLPISFPLAFYIKLLGRKCNLTLDHLEEGWPDLHKGLQSLLHYDGNVEDDLARDYTFGFTANGLHVDVDMQYPWHDMDYPHGPPRNGKMKILQARQDRHHSHATKQTTSSPSEDAAPSTPAGSIRATVPDFDWPGWDVRIEDNGQQPQPVTNDNHHQYVYEYCNWLMDYSIRPQFYTFAKGFYQVVNPRALQLLTPEHFRLLLEGCNDLDIQDLMRATTVSGFSRGSPVLTWFWQIVEDYPQEKQKKLLEFVTASKRVPIGGAGSLTFKIERAGGDTEHLPGSSTCFGTLRLPEYDSKEKLKRKLDIALEHSLGFGQA